MEELLDDLAFHMADPHDTRAPALSLGEEPTARLHALVRDARARLEEQGSLERVRAPRQQYFYSRPAATPPPSSGPRPTSSSSGVRLRCAMPT